MATENPKGPLDASCRQAADARPRRYQMTLLMSGLGQIGPPNRMGECLFSGNGVHALSKFMRGGNSDVHLHRREAVSRRRAARGPEASALTRQLLVFLLVSSVFGSEILALNQRSSF